MSQVSEPRHGAAADDQPFAVYPAEYRAVLDAELRGILEYARDALGMDTAYLGFIDVNGDMHYPDGIRVQGDTYPYEMPYTEGLVGLVLSRDDVFFWPDDECTVPVHKKNDEKATKEIAGPLHFRGKPAGTMWFASHDKEKRFRAEDKQVLFEYLRQVEDLLELNFGHMTDGVEAELTALAAWCMDKTQSDRGYIAVELLDRGLQYFPVGKDVDKFLILSRFEGLCGQAFQTGEVVNCGNVFQDPAYKPSHPSVWSELIVPIVDESGPGPGRCIGLINLESYAKNHFTGYRVRLVRDHAAKAARLTRTFRLREAELVKSSAERAVNGLVGIVETAVNLAVTGRGAVAPVVPLTGAMEEYARQTTGAPRSFWGERDREIPGCWVADGPGTNLIPPPGTGRIGARVLVEGEMVGTLVTEYDPNDLPPTEREVRLLNSAARVGGTLFKLGRWAVRTDRLISLVGRTVNEAADPWTLDRVVNGLPDILESAHCTLFFRLRAGGRSYLVPGPSSCGVLTPGSPSGKPYYDWDPADGMTAFAAVNNRRVVLSKVTDEHERQQFARGLVWRRTLAEEPGCQTTSFMASPIVSPADPREVIGVIRLYRDGRSRRTSYSEPEKEVFLLFAALLGKPLGEFLGGRVRTADGKDRPGPMCVCPSARV